ncbi:D-alanine--D-alanine ligase [Nakamurella antarctica]|uniref:D-alanine--D-alanine ligase n=2 Tax=Nakamurella antarctica TaxID=1902245 RepID=A0A3G8ZZW8_9ACTN|nr:D-alanine--D-alanine ligase [Nakamurella antarctica]
MRPPVGGEKVRVAVVFGGRSGEHGISCVSASGVMRHLDRTIFDVIPVGITTSGTWVHLPQDINLAIVDGKLPQVPAGPPVALSVDPTTNDLILLGDSGTGSPKSVDVIFPVLHGPFGEDGTIQGLIELAGLPYVGAGVLASAAGMDKEFTKKLLAAEGLPVGNWVVLRPERQTLTQSERDLIGLPAFVKPARAGSSLGVSRVDCWEDLEAAIAHARQTDPKVLVEKAVLGREIECGVLEFPDGSVRASPTAEIHLGTDFSFYDFTAKYLDDAATFDIPASLTPETTARLSDLAARAFAALDCQGLARVDFFVTLDGEVVINEINTMPGFTPISMFPRMWLAGGLTYSELLTNLVQTALSRGTGLR